MHSPGFLITVEGIDGCGKSTLIKNISSSLEKHCNLLVTKEPGGSHIGKHLRALLQTQEIPLTGKAEFLLFAADRAQHFETIIIPALQKGMLVISDRCSDSSLAYQGYGRNLDCQLIEQVNQWAMSQVKPNLVFYLKINPDVALTRLMHNRNGLTAFEKRTESFWMNVIHGFEEIFKNRPEVITLDATLNEKNLHEQAVAEIEKRCKIY